MNPDISDNESIGLDLENDMPSPEPTQPVKIRKKPGRKPNPASPALRKAQNRAAQRAFRERKERHMRELEIAIKQIREQRDKLHIENEQMKTDQEIMRSENWYLKGIVLTLQLVCFQHNLVIPQHGPYINEQALSVLAESIPKSISTYISVNASNKLPVPSKLFGYRHTMKQRDRYLSSGSIVITKNGIHSVPDNSTESLNNLSSAPMKDPVQCETTPDESYYTDFPTVEDLVHPLEDDNSTAYNNMPPLSPVSLDSESDILQPDKEFENVNNHVPKPVMLTEETLSSNLAAIQTLRLRLRLQSACVRMESLPFAIQPTILQLTIPHDPRIDLIPTPHMRDRMILFRDQFDLDDCFRCLLGHSVFHGGDPAVAANWQLPPEFFEKYWFLTIDYTLRRTTNHWRRLQGLDDLSFEKEKKIPGETNTNSSNMTSALPPLEQQEQKLNYENISALLGIDFWKIAQETHTNAHGIQISPSKPNYASSLSSDSSYNSNHSQTNSSSTTIIEEDTTPSFEPVRLTDGYSFSFSKPQQITKKTTQKTSTTRHHPYQKQTNTRNTGHSTTPPPVALNSDSTCHPWDTLLADSSVNNDYDIMMENLIDSETIFGS
ncbi:hypothetical protein EDC94DRAFT_690331 [Helicostylum pulchrum]|nr:hypothetical protein EDC94DRAFT_690331 [Helicostylum pulchrum]